MHRRNCQQSAVLLLFVVNIPGRFCFPTHWLSLEPFRWVFCRIIESLLTRFWRYLCRDNEAEFWSSIRPFYWCVASDHYFGVRNAWQVRAYFITSDETITPVKNASSCWLLPYCSPADNIFQCGPHLPFSSELYKIKHKNDFPKFLLDPPLIYVNRKKLVIFRWECDL